MFWLLWEPGPIFWDFVGGAGLLGVIGGVVTLQPGLVVVGVLLLAATLRWGV